LGSAGVDHRFHTLGMRALCSLTRSKIVSANYPGYFVTDPKKICVSKFVAREKTVIRISYFVKNIHMGTSKNRPFS